MHTWSSFGPQSKSTWGAESVSWKATVAKLIKKLPAIPVTPRCSIALTRSYDKSQMNSVQKLFTPHLITVLILSFHLRLGLSCSLSPSILLTESSSVFLSSPTQTTYSCPATNYETHDTIFLHPPFTFPPLGPNIILSSAFILGRSLFVSFLQDERPIFTPR
jgi:hypothetical protein